MMCVKYLTQNLPQTKRSFKNSSVCSYAVVNLGSHQLPFLLQNGGHLFHEVPSLFWMGTRAICQLAKESKEHLQTFIMKGWKAELGIMD